MSKLLPDCMMPDGADPCLGYKQTHSALEEAQADAKRFSDGLATMTERFRLLMDDLIVANTRIKELEAELLLIQTCPLDSSTMRARALKLTEQMIDEIRDTLKGMEEK